MLFVLIFDLYFSIPAVIALIFDDIAELGILIGIPSKEAKAEIEIHPGNLETKIMKLSVQFRIAETFLCFFHISSCWFIFLIK